MTLAAHSLVEQRDTETIQLIEGDIYVVTSSDTKFKTPYAEIRCADDCKAIFNRKSDQILIKSLGGQWIVKRLGDKQEYALHAGLQVTVSEVGTDGMAQMEFPQGLSWEPTVKEWAKFYSSGYAHFKNDLSAFREVWEAAVEKTSEAQLHNATRSIASHQQAVRSEQARQKAREHEDAELRRLFREKNNIDN
jgi:hypothetical protein